MRVSNGVIEALSRRTESALGNAAPTRRGSRGVIARRSGDRVHSRRSAGSAAWCWARKRSCVWFARRH